MDTGATAWDTGCAQQTMRATLTHMPRTTTEVTKARTMGFFKSTAAGGAMMARLQEPRTHVESSVVNKHEETQREQQTTHTLSLPPKHPTPTVLSERDRETEGTAESMWWLTLEET
ncbi:hypothetical protein DR999_PMT05471 [Platysternon megacephalum]|uniref:Uncharacterized protein n=1 Tax=Platysternon megacephalum TaxID=55544 RepID=A0A4D9EVU7_9SAUR|nr:hypothetical protein DR999_PMT05471 [Platysternon megacephalum]